MDQFIQSNISPFSPLAIDVLAPLVITQFDQGLDAKDRDLAMNGCIVNCRLEIHNPNDTQPVNGVTIRTLAIEPPMQQVTAFGSTENWLEMIQGKLKGDGSVISGDQRQTFQLFTARPERTGHTSVVFVGVNDTFHANTEHRIKLEVSCNGLKTVRRSFVFRFNSERGRIYEITQRVDEP
jgi:hypothetical protein